MKNTFLSALVATTMVVGCASKSTIVRSDTCHRTQQALQGDPSGVLLGGTKDLADLQEEQRRLDVRKMQLEMDELIKGMLSAEEIARIRASLRILREAKPGTYPELPQ